MTDAHLKTSSMKHKSPDDDGCGTNDPPRATPVTILTGFLGAGKTTLLNRILNGDHGLRAAVLVNDFGSINIDSDLVTGIESDGDLISLSNGCVCCNIREDLLTAVRQVIARPERPECILLEASGVAEPTGIMLTFQDEGLRDRIRLDSIMCVVDAEQVFSVPEMMPLKLRQIACADMLILNKADLVSRVEIERIKEWLDEHFHRYRLVESTRGEVPMEILLSAGRFDAARLERNHPDPHHCSSADCGHHDHIHSEVFETWSYETNQPLSLESLSRVASQLPADIYRCKGVIHSIESPDHRSVLQVVGKRVDVSTDRKWNREPVTRIVAIGSSGSFSSAKMTETFEPCLARSQPATISNS